MERAGVGVEREGQGCWGGLVNESMGMGRADGEGWW